MKQATKRFVSMVVALLLVVGASVVYFYFIQPSFADALRAKGDVAGREAFVANQRQAIQQVEDLIAAYHGEGKIQEVISYVFPQGEDASDAIAQLNGLSQASNLALQSVALRGQGARAGVVGAAGAGASQSPLLRPVGTLVLQARFAGTYDDLKSFVERLETNIRIFDIQSLSVQAAGKLNQNLYVFDITFTVYYQES